MTSRRRKKIIIIAFKMRNVKTKQQAADVGVASSSGTDAVVI